MLMEDSYEVYATISDLSYEMLFSNNKSLIFENSVGFQRILYFYSSST